MNGIERNGGERQAKAEKEEKEEKETLASDNKADSFRFHSFYDCTHVLLFYAGERN